MTASADKYYATRYKADPDRDKVWRAIAEYVRSRYAPTAESVLDLGSGYGDFINNFEAKQRIAVDMSAAGASHLEKNIEFIEGPASDLSRIAQSSLDLIFSSNLFEHLTDEELIALAGEARRTLRPGGRLITMQPNYYYAYREYFDDYTHKKVFSHAALKDFFEAQGLQCVKMEPRFVPFSMKSRLPKSYWLTRAYLNSPIRPSAKQMLGVFENPVATNAS